jgi:hypothetical protein
MKKHISGIAAIGLLVFVAMACSGSFTTANISKLEFGKNETASPAATSFDASDKIYAVATVANTSQKLKMEFKVTAENVTGAPKGKEVMVKSIDFEGARPIWLQFSVNAPGEYKVEATMSDDTGKKVDSKSGTITVKGSGAPPPSNSKDDHKDDKDSDDK